MDRAQPIATGLPALFEEGKPCLLVLDYAESRSKEIVELVRTAVYAKNAPPVRLVLLARAGGDWWNHLAQLCRKRQGHIRDIAEFPDQGPPRS